MTSKLLAAAFFALMPIAAMACSGATLEEVSICKDGFVWNNETGTCDEIVQS